MKKNMKMITIGIVAISIIFLFIIVWINNNKNSYTRPNYDYIATIYHSEMLGIDAGTEYTYYIYKSEKNDNEYFYIKSKSSITIAGSGESKDIDLGPLKNHNDLKKVKRDIENDSEKNAQSYVLYYYINNGIDETCENIDVLESKLFK